MTARLLCLVCALACFSINNLAHADETLGMVTGPKTSTYIAIGRDIAALAKNQGIQVQIKPSEGSIDNIKRLNSNENAALGIVQSDVLGFMARSKNPETIRMAGRIRMLLPLYREEVHVLAREGINSFSDLEGKKVVIGEDGGGHMLTGINLFAMTGVTPSELIQQSPPDGVLALLEGNADAMIYVGGKPVKLFSNLASLRQTDNARFQSLLAGLHFLPLADPRMLEEYQAAEITHKDYEFVKETVPTIAVTAVLVDYDFSGPAKKDRAKCHAIGHLAGIIRTHLTQLQKTGHPKWKEVWLADVLPIWKKDSCAWPDEKPSKPYQQKQPVQHQGKALPGDLIDVVKQKP